MFEHTFFEEIPDDDVVGALRESLTGLETQETRLFRRSDDYDIGRFGVALSSDLSGAISHPTLL